MASDLKNKGNESFFETNKGCFVNKIKILHVVESFGGGVFGSVSQLCRHLDKSLFEISVAHSIRPETPDDYSKHFDPEVQLVYVPMLREISLWGDLRSLFALIKVFRKYKPDVIHLHSSKAGFLGRLGARLLGIKNVFYSPRGFSFLREDVSPFKRRLYYFLEKVAAKLGGVIIGCSIDEYKYSSGISRKSVFIPNGIDLNLIDQISDKKMSRDRLVVGTSGRITYQKNPELFLKIACSFRQHENLEFVWIGDGEMSAMFNEEDSNVRVTGWMSRMETLELVSSLDVFLQTSLWEGMPVSVLEAMALGKPVIANDVVGNRDLVLHGRTGFLAKQEEEWNGYLESCLNDLQMRKEMGDRGKALIRSKYDIKRIIKDFERLYSESADYNMVEEFQKT